MERLQAAIERARANRASKGDVPQQVGRQREAPRSLPVGDPEVTSVRPVDAVTSEAWASLAPLPERKTALRRNRISAAEGSMKAGPYDMLRTRVLTEMQKNGWRRLLVTSPASSCGKSTTCLNLAFSLSRQPDIRTVLAECDFRRPSINKMLGLQTTVGFGDVLHEEAELKDTARRIGNNVLLVTNARTERDAASLLHSRRMTEVLGEMEQVYQPDLMIFDLPPFLVNDDVLGFVQNVDCVLIMAMAEKTTVSEVDVCEKDLSAHTNVLGVVLNRCRYSSGQYGYDYDY